MNLLTFLMQWRLHWSMFWAEVPSTLWEARWCYSKDRNVKNLKLRSWPPVTLPKKIQLFWVNVRIKVYTSALHWEWQFQCFGFTVLSCWFHIGRFQLGQRRIFFPENFQDGEVFFFFSRPPSTILAFEHITLLTCCGLCSDFSAIDYFEILHDTDRSEMTPWG